MKEILITSKGNGRNFYAYINGAIHECVKENDVYFLAQLVLGKGLVAIGEPLQDFRLEK